MTVRIAIAGAAGRMGRAVIGAAAETRAFVVSGGWVRPDGPAGGQDLGLLAGLGSLGVTASPGLDDAFDGAQAAIDFTLPGALGDVLAACRARGLPLVTGTTGLAESEQAALVEAATVIPIVQAANLSVGVTVLLDLAARAARALGPDFDAEILELHHRHKLDAPSGTALAIGEAVTSQRDGDVAVEAGRGPDSGRRVPGAIGYASVRAGDIVGEHTLLLAGSGERVELTHRAADRRAFAVGALRAAAWLCGVDGTARPPGLYAMADVLGLD